MDAIDWARVAEPQADGYDLRVTLLELMAGRYGTKPFKDVPQDAPLIWPDGRVRWVPMSCQASPSQTLKDMPLSDPRIQQALTFLNTWPEVRSLSAHLLLAVCPMTLGLPEASHGGTCGNYGDDFGWIYATADNAWGLTEGIVHEMGHWKLRALGIWFEDWTDRLLRHATTELFTSPVRKDMARPMGAVIHAQYSYIHVAEMCVRMLRATRVPTSSEIEWTALQLSRITEGQETIRTHAKATPEGDAFLAGMDEWTSRVLAGGAQAVDEAKKRMRT